MSSDFARYMWRQDHPRPRWVRVLLWAVAAVVMLASAACFVGGFVIACGSPTLPARTYLLAMLLECMGAILGWGVAETWKAMR